MGKFPPIDLSRIKTHALSERDSKVALSGFATPACGGASIAHFLTSLPDILIGADFRQFVRQLARAIRNKKTIGIGIGGHVIKCGLSPVLHRPHETRLHLRHRHERRHSHPRHRNRHARTNIRRRRPRPSRRLLWHGARHRRLYQQHHQHIIGKRIRQRTRQKNHRHRPPTPRPQHTRPCPYIRHTSHGTRRHRHRHHTPATRCQRRSHWPRQL